MSEQPAAERPSRHQSSFGGLLAAMLVTVVVVIAYVGFRALTREQPDVRGEPVDYLSAVRDLQAAGTAVVYPQTQPAAWIATSVAFERGDPPQWRIGMLTEDQEFVGVVQQAADVDTLLDEYVDENPDPGPDTTPGNSLGVPTWQSWSDDGGDHAFSTTFTSGALTGQTLLVYGSAPIAEQEALIGLLTIQAVSGA